MMKFCQSVAKDLAGMGLSTAARLARVKPAPLTPQPEWHHLPRLAPEFYLGFTVVQWTITLKHRATGWLDERFHLHFRELLLHSAAREGLFCPVYVLMPDHLHLVWLGLRVDSDQRNAMKFLRKHLTAELVRRSPNGVEFELQKQSHDSVLREQDRVRGAFEKSCFYVLANPRLKGLVEHPKDWPHLGSIVPGYPFLHPLAEDFWEHFWKRYMEKREARPAQRRLGRAPPFEMEIEVIGGVSARRYEEFPALFRGAATQNSRSDFSKRLLNFIMRRSAETPLRRIKPRICQTPWRWPACGA